MEALQLRGVVPFLTVLLTSSEVYRDRALLRVASVTNTSVVGVSRS